MASDEAAEQQQQRETFESGVLQELQWRGLIYQQTHAAELDEALASGPLTLYCGFDPSSDSLHVGHLVSMMSLAFFRRHGHRPIAVAGGATGMIGDPSGKSEERNLLDEETLAQNLAGISAQLQRILDRALELHPETLGERAREVAEAEATRVLDNASWMRSWTFLEFLRDVGKYFRVNHMIQKDSVRARLEDRDQGISYTEFSYMLIQGYDFLHLYEHHDCQLQIGGSDQWGNITAGVELVRRKVEGGRAYGLTFPLLTKADGKKMGKSEQGAIWLDPDRVSPYQLRQYFYNVDDADVPRLLRTFTFLPREEIEALEAERPWEAKAKLAWEVTALVHGIEAADRAERAAQVLFSGGNLDEFSERELMEIFADVPSTTLPRDRLAGAGVDLVDLIAEVGLRDSKSQARRLVEQDQGAYINNVQVTAAGRAVSLDDRLTENMLVLRAGKKKYHLVRIEG